MRKPEDMTEEQKKELTRAAEMANAGHPIDSLLDEAFDPKLREHYRKVLAEDPI